MAFRQAHCLAKNLGLFPQRQACTPQPVVWGRWERPPHKRLIILAQLSLGDLRRPRHPGQRPGSPDQVDDEVLGAPPIRRGPRPEPWLVADCVPRQRANEVVPGTEVAGPQMRLVPEDGVPVARVVSLAGGHAGSGDRQVHAVKAVQELVEESPVYPLRQSEGEEARFPQAGWPLVRRSQMGYCLRCVAKPGAPCHPGIRAVPQDVDVVLVRHAAVGARGIGPRAVALHPGRRPHGPGHEGAQQRILQLGGGRPQRRAAGRGVRPVAPSPEGDRAPCLKLAQGVAAKGVSDPVLELAEGLLHEVQGVLLPRDVPAAPALARAPTSPRAGSGPGWPPCGAVPGGRPPDSQIAWAKTWVTPGRRARRASQRSRSYRVCMTGETPCTLERTVKMTSLAWYRRVAPQRARTTTVSSPRRSGSVTDAAATPWGASGVTSVLMAQSCRS